MSRVERIFGGTLAAMGDLAAGDPALVANLCDWLAAARRRS
jgi:hypothetical protein